MYQRAVNLINFNRKQNTICERTRVISLLLFIVHCFLSTGVISRRLVDVRTLALYLNDIFMYELFYISITRTLEGYDHFGYGTSLARNESVTLYHFYESIHWHPGSFQRPNNLVPSYNSQPWHLDIWRAGSHGAFDVPYKYCPFLWSHPALVEGLGIDRYATEQCNSQPSSFISHGFCLKGTGEGWIACL